MIKFAKNRLIDTHQRPINYLRISITDRCNLRCLYCNPEAKARKLEHREILRYEELLRIIRIGVSMGITKVRVTGGEPLVRKGCCDFLKQIAKIEGIEDLALTTNGVLLKDHIDRIADAGVKRLNISMDTLDPEKYARITGSDVFERVWDGILSAHQKGISPIKINMVVLAGINDEELIDFAKLSLDYPFHFRFIEYMPIGRSIDLNTPPILLPAIKSRIEAIGELIPLQKNIHDGPAARFRFRDSRGEIGFISPVSRHFCAACNRLRVTADGHILSCLLSNITEDIKTPIRAGFLDEALREVFFNATRRKPLQRPVQISPLSQTEQMISIGG
ncbi:MAG: GTP 3',8-cyclase MoaA [Desulfobacterales bacterium]|jgi:cyclic pyranopterin phosphate synthase|nr:GTP 3',8-cyclase MoaA [Desulfobacterales bacterium]